MNEQQIINTQTALLNGRQLFDLEITTRCNKQCYCCPRQNFKRKNLDMSITTFNKVCDWLPQNCDVFFAGYGEPLLHKNCSLFVNKLSKRGVGVSILTNGKLLTTKKIVELFDAGLERLQISILQRDEINEIEKYIKLTKNISNIKIRFNIIYEEIPMLPDNIYANLVENGYEISFKKIHNRANEFFKAKNSNEIVTCGTFFITSFIDTNGSLNMCSNDINGILQFGNVIDTKFAEFQNKKRNFFGNVPISSICNYCTDEYRFKHLNINEI